MEAADPQGSSPGDQHDYGSALLLGAGRGSREGGVVSDPPEVAVENANSFRHGQYRFLAISTCPNPANPNTAEQLALQILQTWDQKIMKKLVQDGGANDKTPC